MTRCALATLTALTLVMSCTVARGQDSAHQARKAYDDRHYATAAALYVQAFEQNPADLELLYGAACAYALEGDRPAALATLTLAFQHGYVNADVIEHDTDFASLQTEPRWLTLLAQMRARAAFDARLWDSPALATGYRANLSDDEKIAGLSKFWSEVKYNFVYVEQLKKLDWDALYLAYLPKVRASTSTAQYYRVLDELCALLQDGHTKVVAPDAVRDKARARVPLRTGMIEGHVMVQEVFEPGLRAHGVLPGMEITAVDGVPVRTYAARMVTPTISASTAQDRAYRSYGYALLEGERSVPVNVTFKDARGKTSVQALQRMAWDDWDKLAVRPEPFLMRTLTGGVAYVALNSFGSAQAADAFMAAFDQIAPSSALIIDLRDNSGGSSNVGYRILATLADRPFAKSGWSTRHYKPSYRAWGTALPNFDGDPETVPVDPLRRYTKPVLLLTAAGTFSAAEDFALAFDAMGRGRIVGEPTGGSSGQPLTIALPGGGHARICTKQDRYPDGRLFVGIGVQPNLLVHPRVADLRRGSDSVLQAALAQLHTASNRSDAQRRGAPQSASKGAQ